MIMFLAVYVQIFFLVTFLEHQKKLIIRKDPIDLSKYPSVTIIVPCYNEERTVFRSIKSLLELDYPKNKLNLILVDDGSTDGTFSILKRFKNKKNIKIYHKENGGKYTALNLGLLNTETEFVGCLDSDSLVHSQALKRIMSTFATDKDLSAVIPSALVYSPRNILERAQKAEYDLIVYSKKMLGLLGGIHVTPGPFSIFRKKVFDELGPYRKAYNTEDQEIALRMHENGYRIDSCHDAYVYTFAPNTIGRLFSQRVRWLCGFLYNLSDYRHLLFKKKFGNLAFFTLPSGIISILGVILMFSLLMSNFISFILRQFVKIDVVGFPPSLSSLKLDFFFINTHSLLFIMIFIYLLISFSLFIGKKIAEGKSQLPIGVFYLFPLYGIIAPLWITKSILNVVFKRELIWGTKTSSL